jgi:type II secretory pathway component PulJ
MQPNRRYTLLSLLAAFLILPLLAGCAGMPLQEMSDARQAIRAAERAGAQQHAPQLLDEARGLVKAASGNMNQGEYREARDQAELAREKAMEARRIAEAAKAPFP